MNTKEIKTIKIKDDDNTDSKDKTSFICEIAKYRILSDKRNYMVELPESSSRKGTSILGFYSTLSNAISDIREQEIKKVTKNSKTIEILVTRLTEFNQEFNKLLAPLKRLEDPELK